MTKRTWFAWPAPASATRGQRHLTAAEWPTLAVAAGCYVAWVGLLAAVPLIGLWPALVLAVPVVTLHSSLQHEAIHGHPTRHAWLNALLVMPAVGLFVPYHRFRDLHVHHHRTERLTDPVHDPESFYLTDAQWRRCRWPMRILVRFTNTLLGRMTLGPALMLARFYRRDAARLCAGDGTVIRAWLVHLAALAPVVAWVGPVCGVDLLIYAAAVAYPALSLLTLRTYGEHQADPRPGARTVIVEDRGPLAWLFLFNNLHVVHHRRPDLPWYVLSRAYWRNRDLWLAANDGYLFTSYRALIARHLLRAKEPVLHPMPAGELG